MAGHQPGAPCGWHDRPPAVNRADVLLQAFFGPTERSRIAAPLQHHYGHDVGYFGPGTLEQFPILDGD
jgi:hypothetical protein